MYLNNSGGGDLLSSSAPIILLVGLLVVLVSHQGIRGWFQSRNEKVREHLFGPPDLHLPVQAAATNDTPAPENGADPEDTFDYDIYGAAHGVTAASPSDPEN